MVHLYGLFNWNLSERVWQPARNRTCCQRLHLPKTEQRLALLNQLLQGAIVCVGEVFKQAISEQHDTHLQASIGYAVLARSTIICPIRCLCLMLARKDVRRRTIRRGGEVLAQRGDEQVVAFDLASFLATRTLTGGDQALDKFGCYLFHDLPVAA